MARITHALLLSPDRATVVLGHAAVRASVGAPLEFSEQYPDAPKLGLSVFAGIAGEAWTLGRVLRLEYDDGTAEAWRVRRARRTYTGRGLWPVDLDPLWLDLAHRTLVAEIEGTSVATPRLALISRTPASALGVAFDPLSGAPAVASGAPMFIVGSIDERYAAERVDVSVVGGSPMDVLEAVASELRCLWRARLVLSGDGPADEVYEVDLYAPSEPTDVASQAFETATAEKVLAGSVADVGNAPGMARPNALALDIEDDVSGLVTAIVPLASAEGEDAVGVALAAFVPSEISPVVAGRRTLTLSDRDNRPARVVPYDGALDGLLLELVLTGEAWTVVASRAPDVVELDMAGSATVPNSHLRFMRPGTAGGPRRALVQLANRAAVDLYGLLSEARTYDDVSPYHNEFLNGACDEASTTLPAWFLARDGFAAPAFAWTDAEPSVSAGIRSAQFTAAADGEGVVALAPVASRLSGSLARSAWVSMRVLSGRVDVTMLVAGGVPAGMTPASIVLSADTAGTGETAGGGVLTTVEMAAADVGPAVATAAVAVQFKAVGGPAVWVVDAVTVVQATTAQPYRTLMGPNALWLRAWDDLLLAPRRVTTASTTAFDPEALGLPAEDLSPGAWVRVRPDGREPVELQVLEARWEQDLSSEGMPGGLAAERQMRLGPPPYDIVQRLSSGPDRARAPEGSKRAPVYPYLLDRGAVAGGRRIEGAGGASFAEGTVTRTFLGRTYELDTIDPEPGSVDALYVRRTPGLVPRSDAAVLRLSTSP